MKKLFCAAIAAVIIMTLVSCSGGGPENQVFSGADMAGKTVGVLEGSLSEAYMIAFGRAEIKTYSDPKSLARDVRDGTLDCALVSSGDAGRVTGRGLKTLDEPYADDDYAIPVSAENRLLIDNLESAMVYMRASGKISSIIDRWEDGGEPQAYEPAPDAQEISVAISADVYPYAFYDDEGELAGIEVDVVRGICDYLKLRPEFSVVDADILLYMAESGKTAFAIGRIASDPDNEAVVFTSSYLHSTQLIVVRK